MPASIDDDNAIWKRDEIESPCVNICVVHPGAEICVGCRRTPDEIARWSSMTPLQRREIMAGLADRAPLLRRAGALPSERRGRASARRRARMAGK